MIDVGIPACWKIFVRISEAQRENDRRWKTPANYNFIFNSNLLVFSAQ